MRHICRMLGLRWLLVATGFTSSDAELWEATWHTIRHGNRCLATEQMLDRHMHRFPQMYGGAPVSLIHCEGLIKDSTVLDWYVNFNESNRSQPFDIRVGARSDWSVGKPQSISTWCLNANSSALSIQECNSSPQQQFTLGSVYDGIDSPAYLGVIRLINGLCVDGTELVARTCYGSSKLWDICTSTESLPWAGSHSKSNCAWGGSLVV